MGAVENRPAAELSVWLGAGVTVEARVTSAGLLSIGALVSGILLSTAVVVHAAGRKTTARAQPSQPSPPSSPSPPSPPPPPSPPSPPSLQQR